MVGLIQKVLLDLVHEEGGGAAVAAVREAAGIPPEREFRIGVSYDDEEFRRLVAAAQAHLGLSEDGFWDRYTEAFLTDALRRWPVWFEMSASAREFLERQPVIHNSFASGLREEADRRAVNDKFRVAEGDPDELVVTYRSSNRLSALYVALARGVLRHYGEEAAIEATPLPASGFVGGEAVEIRIRWASGPGRTGSQVENHRVLSREGGTPGVPPDSTFAGRPPASPALAS
jgi:hypothetical protein